MNVPLILNIGHSSCYVGYDEVPGEYSYWDGVQKLRLIDEEEKI